MASTLWGGEKTMFFLTKRTAPSEGESIFYREIKSKQPHVKLLKKRERGSGPQSYKKVQGFPPPLSKKKKKKNTGMDRNVWCDLQPNTPMMWGPRGGLIGSSASWCHVLLGPRNLPFPLQEGSGKAHFFFLIKFLFQSPLSAHMVHATVNAPKNHIILSLLFITHE